MRQISDARHSNDKENENNHLPLSIRKPPSNKTIKRAKVPKVLATTSVLPIAAMSRNSDRAV